MLPDDSNAETDAGSGGGSIEGATPVNDARGAVPAKKFAKMMLYTHPKVARKIKQIALDNERKANDVILDALDLYFAKHGHVGLRHVIESKG